jgi:hypothetical protein
MALSTVWTINSRTKISLLGCEKQLFHPEEGSSRFMADDTKYQNTRRRMQGNSNVHGNRSEI